MKKVFSAALFIFLLILISSVSAGAFEIGVRGSYWFPSLDADMKADNAGVVGTNVNLKDTLNVDNESFPIVEAFGGIGRHSVSLSYTPLDYSGSTTLTVPVNFNGKSYAVGANVTTDLELRMLDLQYKYKFFDAENVLAGFSLSAIGQVKYIDGLAKISAPATGTSSEFTIETPIPMVGVGAHVGILADVLSARAIITGVAYSGNYLYEALADLSFTPDPFWGFSLGYKTMSLKIDHNDVYLDSTFSGPFVSVTLSF